jgi:hypothetical protein
MDLMQSLVYLEIVNDDKHSFCRLGEIFKAAFYTFCVTKESVTLGYAGASPNLLLGSLDYILP